MREPAEAMSQYALSVYLTHRAIASDLGFRGDQSLVGSLAREQSSDEGSL
jgi:hypothetical protein